MAKPNVDFCIMFYSLLLGALTGIAGGATFTGIFGPSFGCKAAEKEAIQLNCTVKENGFGIDCEPICDDEKDDINKYAQIDQAGDDAFNSFQVNSFLWGFIIGLAFGFVSGATVVKQRHASRSGYTSIGSSDNSLTGLSEKLSVLPKKILHSFRIWYQRKNNDTEMQSMRRDNPSYT